MKKTGKINVWTNICFIDMNVEWNDKIYEWEGILDGKIKTYEICDEDGPIEDHELWTEISNFAISMLDDENTQSFEDLNDRLKRISYEG